MTHPAYSQQQLQLKSLARLKEIYNQIACTVEVTDKRRKDAWINAIVTHLRPMCSNAGRSLFGTIQSPMFIAEPCIGKGANCDQSSQLVHVDPETAAPDELTVVEISFYDHEIYADDKLVAKITYDHDDFQTQRWVVMVNSVEIHRADTWLKCHDYITWHHKQGTLPVQRHQTPAVTTGNEVMASIATECEKFGFDLLEDGIYHNDVRLGEVGCTDGRWWVVRASSTAQNQIPCDSAFDAVWSLSMVEVLPSALTLSAVEGSKNEKDYIFVIRNQDMELVESGFRTAKEALVRAKSLADLRKQFS